MVHILASIAFTLVTVSTFALTALMLVAARGEIFQALGMEQTTRPVARRAVSVRTAGRWQSAQRPAAQPQRAAA